MNHIPQTQTPQATNNVIEVAFYPSLDDYVHIAAKIAGSVPTNTLTGYAYYLFLFLNTVLFPVFLWISDYLLAGLIVFVLNLGALMLIIPRVNSAGFRKYYEHVFGDREKHVATVTLTDAGLVYVADGAESFLPWKRIETIEETEESIYFYFDGNGFAVRKSGFPYEEDADKFVTFAKHRLLESRTHQLEAA